MRKALSQVTENSDWPRQRLAQGGFSLKDKQTQREAGCGKGLGAREEDLQARGSACTLACQRGEGKLNGLEGRGEPRNGENHQFFTVKCNVDSFKMLSIRWKNSFR